MFEGHLSSLEVNRAAREVAARAVVTPSPLKVPLAESANIRGTKMSLQSTEQTAPQSTHVVSAPSAKRPGTKRFVTHGTPVLIAKLLTRYKHTGLDSEQITDMLKDQLPEGWKRQNTSNQLTFMRERGWITKWPGNIWKMGPKDFAYHSQGKHVKTGPKRGKPTDVVRLDKPAKVKPAASSNMLMDLQAAIEAAKDALTKVGQLVADFDTARVKLHQREQAVAAAAKLLAQAVE